MILVYMVILVYDDTCLYGVVDVFGYQMCGVGTQMKTELSCSGKCDQLDWILSICFFIPNSAENETKLFDRL